MMVNQKEAHNNPSLIQLPLPQTSQVPFIHQINQKAYKCTRTSTVIWEPAPIRAVHNIQPILVALPANKVPFLD